MFSAGDRLKAGSGGCGGKAPRRARHSPLATCLLLRASSKVSPDSWTRSITAVDDINVVLRDCKSLGLYKTIKINFYPSLKLQKREIQKNCWNEYK